MAIFIAVCVIAACGVALVRLLALGIPSERTRSDVDVTDRDPELPAHPREPIPGSATDRQRHGMP